MRLLLATQSAYGYASSMAEVARVAIAAGHEVRVVTGHRARGLFPPETIVAAGPSDVDTFVTHEWAHPVSNALQLKHVELALREAPADVVVTSDLSYGVRLASLRHGLPQVTIHGSSWLYPQRSTRGAGPLPTDPELDLLREYQQTESERLFADTATAVGVTGPLPALAFLGDRSLVRSVPSLHPELAGSIVPRLAGCVLAADPVSAAPAGPRVLVALARTFGAFDPWERLVAGLRGSVDLDVLVGRADLEGAAVPDWPDIQILEQPPPGGFGAYDRVVVAGTTTQTLAALRAGCAIVVCPAGAEQPIIGRDLALRGRAALVVDRPVAPADLDEACVRRGQSPSARTAAELAEPFDLDLVVAGW